jgi:hypothetical protein
MTGYTYLDNTGNPQPTVTVLNQGDYLVSPSGTYNAVLTNSGTFVVSYGDKPNVYPSTWAVNPNWGGFQVNGPWTIQNVPNFTNNQYYLYGTHNSNNGWQWPIIAAENDTNTRPDFMQLNDDGTLSIYPGNNGMKTGPAIFATVAPGYAVSPGFSGISVPVTSVTLDSINYDTADAVYKVLDPLAAYDCISEPGGCPTGPGAAVPEPPTFVTVPLAFAALLALAAVRRRRRRGSLRDNGFRVLRLA